MERSELPLEGLRRVRHRPFPVGPSSFEEIWDHRTPASVAIVDGDEALTTRALRAEVDRTARCLVERGVTPGQRVAWLVDNDIAGVVGLLATVRVGAVWVPLSPRSTAAERRVVLDQTRPTALIDAPPVHDPDVTLPALPGRDAIAAIAFTSGTTGRPKGAVHTQQQLLFPAAAAIATEGLDPTARIATPLSLSTLNLMLLGPLTALACGGTAVLVHRTDATGFAAAIAEQAITRALVVPTIVHDLVSSDIETDLLASLDRLIMGGAGYDRARAADAQSRLGIALIASYGLSEAPTGVARMRVGDAGAMPLPGVEIRIEADGEITLGPTVTGPWAHTWQGTCGYLGDAAATAHLWRDGRLHTGDAGTIDADGLLTVTGRVSEMINRGGSTIAPAEIEAVIANVNPVEDVAVFGIDDARLGQVVAAAVVGPTDTMRLAQVVRTQLSGYKVPERWLVVDAIPRNPNGKVDRRALRAMLD